MPDHTLKLLPDSESLLAWVSAPRARTSLVWYLNPHTLRHLQAGAFAPSPEDRFVADGGLMRRCLSRQLARPVDDLSLRLPGPGDDLVSHLARTGQSLALVGGRAEEAGLAAERLGARHPGLACVYSGAGYARDTSAERTLERLASARPDVVILSMGSPRQEQFAARIAREIDHPMVLLAAGAFVRQTARGDRHYPKVLDRGGLRWLWRMPREPHIAARVGRDYVPFAIRFGLLGRPLPLALSVQENSA